MNANALGLLAAIMTVLTSGAATTYLTEFLKLSFIKIPAEKYPRATAGVLSVLTSVVALLIQGVTFDASPITIIGIGAGTFLLSGTLYNVAVKGLPTNKQ